MAQKALREWFELLPEGIKEKATNNAIACNYPGWLNDLKTDSLGRALSGGFIWKFTPEGHDYWNEVSERYKDK